MLSNIIKNLFHKFCGKFVGPIHFHNGQIHWQQTKNRIRLSKSAGLLYLHMLHFPNFIVQKHNFGGTKIEFSFSANMHQHTYKTLKVFRRMVQASCISLGPAHGNRYGTPLNWPLAGICGPANFVKTSKNIFKYLAYHTFFAPGRLCELCGRSNTNKN